MHYRPSRGVAAAILVAFSLSFLLPSAPAAAGRQLVQASGGPIVDCTGTSLARLESGMGVQREALQRAERMYRQAEETHRAAADPDRELNILRDRTKKWLEDQITLTRKVRALRALGLSPARTRELLTLTGRIEKAVEEVQGKLEKIDTLAGAGAAGVDFGKAINDNVDLLEGYSTFLADSGIGEEAVSLLANAGFGPAGGLVIQGLGLAQDYVLGAAGEVIAERDLLRMRDNLDDLRRAVSNNEARILDLRAMMTENCKPSRTQTQESPRPIPPQEAAVQPEPPKKKGGGGKVASVLIAAGVAGGVGLYVSNELSKLDLSGDGDGGTGGGQPTLQGSPRFTCSGSQCSGDIVVRFPSAIRSGFVTAATSTAGFLGQTQVSQGFTGDVTIRMSRPYNFCYQTQTGLALWDAPTMDGPNTWALTVSIPVTCN